MRILSVFLIFVMLLSFAACTTDPVVPVDTTDTTDTQESTTPEETTTAPPETEPVEEVDLAYQKEIVVEYEDFTVTLSAPAVVGRGTVGDTKWGHNQFPSIRYTDQGYLLGYWMYGDDSITATDNKIMSKISVNGGKSWIPNTGNSWYTYKTNLMTNGKYFHGFSSAGTVNATEILSKYEPGVENGDRKIYFADDLKDDAEAIEKRIHTLSVQEYDGETGEITTIESTINWPYAPISYYSAGYAFTLSGFIGQSHANVFVAEDGTLYTCVYTVGFDSFASSKEEAVTEAAKNLKSSVYVLESPDCGRTWTLISQVIPGDEVDQKNRAFEGYTEPKMIEMPDGSFLMLMRAGSNDYGYLPMYVTRSTDRGRTWTTPEEFDYCGVLPQLLRLENGITIASYGRPDLFIRLTSDPSGAEWEEHVQIPLASNSRNIRTTSCFYTGMQPLSENSAILIYSDFKYPNKDGDPVKTILTRIITITPNE